MPIKSSELADSYEKHYQNHSFETLAASWLTADGWEVLVPMIDHGRKTDIVVSDGTKFYRIQVKSLECSNESVVVENKWSNADSTIDYVIYFSKSAPWGFVAKAFKEPRKPLNSRGHVRFNQNAKHFIEAFKKV